MFGNMIGKGYTVKSAMMEMKMVAEGYYAVKGVHKLKGKFKKKVKTPIIDAVYAVLYEASQPKKVFEKLTDKLD
jgi:glycerol-3-phosphate dehydrogenase (NAD(P)+)